MLLLVLAVESWWLYTGRHQIIIFVEAPVTPGLEKELKPLALDPLALETSGRPARNLKKLLELAVLEVPLVVEDTLPDALTARVPGPHVVVDHVVPMLALVRCTARKVVVLGVAPAMVRSCEGGRRILHNPHEVTACPFDTADLALR